MEPTDIISIIIATTAAAIALLIYVYTRRREKESTTTGVTTRNSTNDTRLRAFDVSTPNFSVVAGEIRGHRYEDHLWESRKRDRTYRPIVYYAKTQPCSSTNNWTQETSRTGIPDFHKKSQDKFNHSAGEKIENLKAITATPEAAGQGIGAIREVRAYNPAIGVVHPPPIRNARS